MPTYPTYLCSLLTVGALLSITGAPAGAQPVPDSGGRVFGSVGGVFGDGDSTVMTSVGAGVRASRHLGIDLEVLYAGDLGLFDDVDFIIQTFGLSFAPVEWIEHSRLVSFLTKTTAEFPIADGRVWPYLTGGGGIGSLRQTLSFRNLPFPRPNADPARPSIFPGPEIDTTTTALALTIGGGVDVRLWRGFGVGGDVRYFRLLDNTASFDFAFVTSRLSYRF